MTLRELHLFAGIGGGILGGLLLGHRCVGAVEIDPYCRRVLEARQRDGILEQFPIHDDIRTFDGTTWRGRVDVVCGGFPCQPWSAAGKRLGTADPRHLWPDMARVVAEVRPRFVFAENVSLAAFEEPWRDLRGLGYRVPPALRVSAANVGAPHRRERWWLLAADAECQPVRQPSIIDLEPGIAVRAQPRMHGEDWHVANAESLGWGARRPEPAGEQGRPSVAGGGSAVANADGAGLAQREGERRDDGEELAAVVENRWWATEPDVGGTLDGLSTWMVGPRWAAGWESGVDRVASGVPHRVARLRALGNAQVPIVAATAFRELMARFGAEVRA